MYYYSPVAQRRRVEEFLLEVTWPPKEITVPPQALHTIVHTTDFGRYSDVRKEIVSESVYTIRVCTSLDDH